MKISFLKIYLAMFFLLSGLANSSTLPGLFQSQPAEVSETLELIYQNDIGKKLLDKIQKIYDDNKLKLIFSINVTNDDSTQFIYKPENSALQIDIHKLILGL